MLQKRIGRNDNWTHHRYSYHYTEPVVDPEEYPQTATMNNLQTVLMFKGGVENGEAQARNEMIGNSLFLQALIMKLNPRKGNT